MKKIKRFFARRILRGSNKLYKSNNHNAIIYLKEDISNYKIVNNIFFSNIFFRDLDNYENIIISQYLTNIISNRYFNKAILFFIGINYKIIYPLPLFCLKLGSANNLKFNYLFSIIAWYLLSFLLIAYSIKFPLRYSLLFIKNLFMANCSPKNFIYFSSIDKGCTYLNLKSKNLNIISWFYIKYKKKYDFENICHDSIDHDTKNKNVFYVKSVLPPIQSFYKLTLFFIEYIKLIIVTLINLLFLKWIPFILLNEIIKSKIFISTEKSNIGKVYLFNNSQMRYRPIWTYIAEKKGADIIFYYYSVNNEKIQNIYSKQKYFYGLDKMSWSKYLVWDLNQKNKLIHQVGKDKDICVVGYIPFSVNPFLKFSYDHKYIVVFPIQPKRKFLYKTTNMNEVDYCIPSSCKKFLDDISILSKKHKIHIILKQKRKISTLFRDTGYNNYTNNLIKNNKSLNIIDEEFSVQQIISNSMGVISYPFTSTAKIANYMNIPSIYYDTSQIIHKNDPGAEDIEMINQINDLEEWIKKIIK